MNYNQTPQTHTEIFTSLNDGVQPPDRGENTSMSHFFEGGGMVSQKSPQSWVR